MADDVLPIPLELPWKLASTTQRLKEGFPDDTTISLFFYEPKTDNLTTDYPDERLIYLKFTVSVSPCHLESGTLPEWARSLLVGGSPVLHLVLDVGVTPEPFTTGGFRPYFHAAAPIRRSMIETGVIGREIFEGESDGLSVGKSASQLYETVGSKVTTNKKGSTAGLPGIFNVSTSSVDTTVNSERALEQFQETVNREASVERRELLSHTTNVENVITLLTAKHVGSPYLRFALSPRPLTQLSVDPGDPNLWYKQLLQRRSSGIEGIQEFVGVVAVPRNMDFCIQALLRRICVLDDPPVPPELPRTHRPSETEVALLVEYLYRKYPIGTPLDELDIDVLDSFANTDRIPALSLWSIPSTTIAYGAGAYPSLTATPPQGFHQDGFAYKTSIEVRRDMLIDEYLEELARSPLERGIVVMHATSLRTCFRMSDTGPNATGVESAATPPTEVPVDPGLSYVPPRDPGRTAASVDSSAAVTRWNALERQLAADVSQLSKEAGQPLSLTSPKMLQVFLRMWSKLSAKDPRNLPLDRAAILFKLTRDQLAKLKTAKVRDLKGLALTLLAAPRVADRNVEIEEYLAQLDEKERCKIDLEPIKISISPDDADRILTSIRAALSSGAAGYEQQKDLNADIPPRGRRRKNR
jgi:hypothetical protein